MMETTEFVDLKDGIYNGKWSAYTITLNNGYVIKTKMGVRGINIPVNVRIIDGKYEILDENKSMNSDEAKDVLQRIKQEGFHYCFEHYSDWEEIFDKKFHNLREQYLKISKELQTYLIDCSDEDSEDGLFKGETVLCTWGYNDITKKPFSFLYDFGYYNFDGDCIVYNHGECNMQDAHCFKRNEVRKATSEDLKNEFWGG